MKRWMAVCGTVIVLAVIVVIMMVIWDDISPASGLARNSWDRLSGPQSSRPMADLGANDSASSSAARVSNPLDITPPHLRADSSKRSSRVPAVESSQRLPDLPVSQIIAMNRDRALAGDSGAAYDIGVALWQCNRFSARERRIARQSPDSPFYQSELRDAEKWLDRCEGVGAKDLSKMLFWIELAANNGNIPAMNLYRIATIEEMTAADMLANPQALAEYKRRSVEYLFAAVNAGSASALRTLGQLYAHGTLVQGDPVLAYAYELAYFQRSSRSELGRQILNTYSENLSDAERERGHELAERILANCCG